MKQWPLLSLAGILAFSACKKDDDPTICEPEPILNYYPGEVGSYWVYEWHSRDSNGEEKLLNFYDSIYVSGDSIINGQKFMVKKGSYFGGSYHEVYRDDQGHLFNSHGSRFFSPKASSDTIQYYRNQSIQTDFYVQMVDPGFDWVTPAGTFEVLDARTTLETTFSVSWSNPQYLHKYWSNGIGIVGEETFFFSNPTSRNIRRLVRYHIE